MKTAKTNLEVSYNESDITSDIWETMRDYVEGSPYGLSTGIKISDLEWSSTAYWPPTRAISAVAAWGSCWLGSITLLVIAMALCALYHQTVVILWNEINGNVSTLSIHVVWSSLKFKLGDWTMNLSSGFTTFTSAFIPLIRSFCHVSPSLLHVKQSSVNDSYLWISCRDWDGMWIISQTRRLVRPHPLRTSKSTTESVSPLAIWHVWSYSGRSWRVNERKITGGDRWCRNNARVHV